MEPLTTAGAILGSLVQRMSPDFIISWLFVAIVGLVSGRTWLKGQEMLQVIHLFCFHIHSMESFDFSDLIASTLVFDNSLCVSVGAEEGR